MTGLVTSIYMATALGIGGSVGTLTGSLVYEHLGFQYGMLLAAFGFGTIGLICLIYKLCN